MYVQNGFRHAYEYICSNLNMMFQFSRLSLSPELLKTYVMHQYLLSFQRENNAFVLLSFFVYLLMQRITKSFGRIAVKFSGKVHIGPSQKWSNFSPQLPWEGPLNWQNFWSTIWSGVTIQCSLYPKVMRPQHPNFFIHGSTHAPTVVDRDVKFDMTFHNTSKNFRGQPGWGNAESNFWNLVLPCKNH